MQKEIFEQPEVVGHTLAHLHRQAAERVALPSDCRFDLRRSTASRSSPAAPPTTPAWSPNTGSSNSRGLPVEIDVACEFRYRDRRSSPAGWRCSSRNRAKPPTRWRRCATPRARADDRRRSSTCRPRPSRARPTCVLPTLAGPEIGVASTKAFTCQLAVLAASGDRGWPCPRRAVGERREASSSHALIEAPRPDRRGAGARAEDRRLAHDLARPRRALSRPRRELIRWRSKAR